MEVAVGPVFVDRSTQLNFATATCVEVAVGPVCLEGSAQMDFMAAACVEVAVGPVFVAQWIQALVFGTD